MARTEYEPISAVNAGGSRPKSGEAETERRHVVLVHGFADRPRVFHDLSIDLWAAGMTPLCPELAPSDGRVPLESLAEQVRNQVDAAVPRSEDIAVVGFSMGALVARYYLQCLCPPNRASALYTIGCPHGGTLWGHARLTAGIAQMRPGSPFLRNLSDTESRLAGVTLVSAYTPWDLSVMPASNALWPMAENRAFRVPVHAWMPYLPSVRDDVVRTIASRVR